MGRLGCFCFFYEPLFKVELLHQIGFSLYKSSVIVKDCEAYNLSTLEAEAGGS